MNPEMALWLSLGAALLAVLYGMVSVTWVLGRSPGNERMQEIASAIQEGAKAYMNRQYLTIGVVGVILFLVLGIAIDWASAVGFAIGAVFSALAGYIGMFVSVRANVRTAEAATQGVNPALRVAFRGGAFQKTSAQILVMENRVSKLTTRLTAAMPYCFAATAAVSRASLLKKPLKGGTPASERAATRNSSASPGRCRSCPPISLSSPPPHRRSRVPPTIRSAVFTMI